MISPPHPRNIHSFDLIELQAKETLECENFDFESIRSDWVIEMSSYPNNLSTEFKFKYNILTLSTYEENIVLNIAKNLLCFLSEIQSTLLLQKARTFEPWILQHISLWTLTLHAGREFMLWIRRMGGAISATKVKKE